MYILFFDTKTTGLPFEEKDPFHYPEYWPHMIQLAWMLFHDQILIEEKSVIICPEGYTISVSVTGIHGITNERAKKEGRPLTEVLAEFSETICRAEVIVGHNVGFDRSVVTAEFA